MKLEGLGMRLVLVAIDGSPSDNILEDEAPQTVMLGLRLGLGPGLVTIGSTHILHTIRLRANQGWIYMPKN